jgi:ribonuclease E
MGQAVDLPDPAQAPASAAATSADDLLSQLAGDEIDRLLAESDAESAVQAEAQSAAPTAAEPAAPSAATPPAAVAESPAAATSSSPATEGLVNELDSLLSQAVAKGAAPASADSPASAEASPTADPAVTEPAVTLDAKAFDASLAAQSTTPSAELKATVSEIETSLQERTGLTDSTTGEPATEEAVENTPVPIYLKPLVWLNAPMLLLPEPIRDAIGKIAVLTMFNSVAVLVYVLMFRRHHR